jgi:hypothetical protein
MCSRRAIPQKLTEDAMIREGFHVERNSAGRYRAILAAAARGTGFAKPRATAENTQSAIKGDATGMGARKDA